MEKVDRDAKKEVSVKRGDQIKGKLNVGSFINSYPDFVEAEKKGTTKISRFLIDIY